MTVIIERGQIVFVATLETFIGHIESLGEPHERLGRDREFAALCPTFVAVVDERMAKRAVVFRAALTLDARHEVGHRESLSS